MSAISSWIRREQVIRGSSGRGRVVVLKDSLVRRFVMPVLVRLKRVG